MHSNSNENQLRLATLRLSDQVAHLTQLVAKMQSSIIRLEQENFNLKVAISNEPNSPNSNNIVAIPECKDLLFQPAPIKLFSSSPVVIQEPADDDLVMSYFCNSSPGDLDQTIFKSEMSPMMGYYDTTMDLTNFNETILSNTQQQQSMSSHSTALTIKSHRKITRKATGPLKILIVEDDPLCQTLISHIIKSLHVGQCEVVADGVEAVINMSTNSFDLILMDMQLPHLDGLQATQNIRKFNRRTPIVSMTARLGEDDIKRYFEGGIDEVLPKPFDKQSVRRIIEQFYKLSINEDSIEEIEM